MVAFAAALCIVLGACGGDDSDAAAEGTWVHEEEGTLVLQSGGAGSLTQSSDPVSLEWTLEGDTIEIDWDNGNQSQATLDGDELTFRAGDFSGDEPEVFVRQD